MSPNGPLGIADSGGGVKAVAGVGAVDLATDAGLAGAAGVEAGLAGAVSLTGDEGWQAVSSTAAIAGSRSRWRVMA